MYAAGRSVSSLRQAWSEGRRLAHLGPPSSILAEYATIFMLLVLPPLILGAYLVATSFHPLLSIDFLFLYFGISSTISVGIWSTSTLADRDGDKRMLFFPSILSILASLQALWAAVAGPKAASLPLDFSVSFMAVAMGWLVLHATAHTIGAEFRLKSAALTRANVPPTATGGAEVTAGQPPGPIQ